MSLSKAINFSSLAAQLTPLETISFIKDVANSNHQIIIDALSSYFLHAPPNDERVNVSYQYIKSISSIIQSRDSQNDHEEKSLVTFDSLPRRLVGVCGSFLEQGSFRSLSKVNRAVYLGCNTPIVLTELHKHYLTATDHSSFNFSVFPFVKKLILKVDIHYDESVLSVERMNVIAGQIAKMSQLQSLQLFEVDAELIGIIANHKEANRRTKCLYVEQQQTGHAALDRFISSITSFEHLQFLKVSLAENQNSADLDMKSIIEMCSNLKGLDFYDSHLGIEMPILQAIGHQLRYLVFYDIYLDASHALKDVNFAHLRQLKQGASCLDDSFRFILKTAINLEKVKVPGESELIKEILTQCKRLKYLEVRCDNDIYMGDVLDVMQQFFDENRDVFKETLKFRVHSSLHPACTQQQAKNISKCQGTINSMAASKVDQWMIILALYSMRGINVQTFYEELRRKLNWNNDIARTAQVGELFVITNPDCTINGIGESWLM